jgi:hypothetical protein
MLLQKFCVGLCDELSGLLGELLEFSVDFARDPFFRLIDVLLPRGGGSKMRFPCCLVCFLELCGLCK